MRTLRVVSSGYEAVFDLCGGSLAQLRHEGRDLVVPYDPAAGRPVYRGAVLAPWPNRVIDAVYAFDGEDHRLRVNEPARGHALHGLAADVLWDIAGPGRLRTVVAEQEGYPFRLALELAVDLGPDGLTQRLSATNLGTRRAPYGMGTHPYLAPGTGRLDDWVLRSPASEYIATRGPRLIPAERLPVPADYDFRAARPIGATRIDHAFTGWGSGPRIELRALDGAGVRMSWDDALRWVQLCTADHTEPLLHRRGLAVEPMSCPPDAFKTGVDLRVLDPGQTHSAWWRIAAI